MAYCEDPTGEYSIAQDIMLHAVISIKHEQKANVNYSYCCKYNNFLSS